MIGDARRQRAVRQEIEQVETDIEMVGQEVERRIDHQVAGTDQRQQPQRPARAGVVRAAGAYTEDLAALKRGILQRQAVGAAEAKVAGDRRVVHQGRFVDAGGAALVEAIDPLNQTVMAVAAIGELGEIGRAADGRRDERVAEHGHVVVSLHRQVPLGSGAQGRMRRLPVSATRTIAPRPHERRRASP